MSYRNKLNRDESFGIIPLNKKGDKWEVFIVQHKAGHWGFPKGHKIHKDEDPKEAAQRELEEETGLKICYYLSDISFQENYECIIDGNSIFKTVTFFLAVVEGSLELCPDEIKQGCWVELDKAYDHLTFNESKKIISKVAEIL